MKRTKKTVMIGLIVICAVVTMLFLKSLSPKRAENPIIPETSPAEETEPDTPEKPGEPAMPPQDSDSAPAGTEEEAPLMATPHFAMAEYQCDCTGYCDGWPSVMAPELLEKIEALRCSFERPVIITSGVRCAARNEEVGGVSWSFHKRGCAADLYCPGVGVGDLAAGAKDCGLNVLPYYSSGYIHVEIMS